MLMLSAGGPVHAAGADPVARALAHIRTHADLVRHSADEAFLVRDVIVDADGSEHVRFERRHKGLRAIGADVVVHSRGNGSFRSASHTLARHLEVDTTASVDEDSAIVAAEAGFAGRRTAPSRAELAVYARGAEPILVWDVLVTGVRADGTPAEVHVIVDANLAAVVDSWDDVQTAASPGLGNSYFNGQVTLTTDSQTSNYALRDPTRGNQSTRDMRNRSYGSGVLFTDTDNVWGDFTTANRATVAVDAQYGASVTWDYFLNVHGRSGIADNGVGAVSRVHYRRKYNNAFWSDSCFCMTYGDGDGVVYNPFDSLDVAGHEMTHGVTSRTANLIYSGESGGLNEATSDIFGTVVEYHAGNAADPGDYLIGERLYRSNPAGTKALRYMFKPSLDTRSPDCYSGGIGGLDVHYSSGVANHFFYLLAEGAVVPGGFVLSGNDLVCNGDTGLAGIGREAAGRIWYRALAVYMTSNTGYSGARAATLDAAADLYGTGSAEYDAVAAAWDAVNVF
jgi:Zn-dependent metalloprotease